MSQPYNYVYLFSIGGSKIVWSGETAASLLNRADNDDDRQEINDFLIDGKVGHFITLSTGEFIFKTS